MRNNSLLIILFCTSTCTSAQVNVNPSTFVSDTTKFQFTAFADYTINSNGVTNQLLYDAFGKGEFLTRESREQALLRKSNNNIFGIDLHAGGAIDFQLKSLGLSNRDNARMWISFGDRQWIEGQFNNELLLLLLYGNAQFKGRTINFDELHFQSIKYQQYEIGYSDKFNNSTRWGIGLSYLNGESYQDVSANRGRFFTSSRGDSLALDASGGFVSSDTANNDFGANNGNGIGLSLFITKSLRLANLNQNGKFSLFARDIGFIRYNQQTLVVPVDTVWEFDGVGIPDVFDLQDSAFVALEGDSLNRAFTKDASKELRTANLPMVFGLSFKQPVSKYTVGFDFQQRFFSRAKPYLEGNLSRQFGSHFSAGLRAGAGAYGSGSLGVDLKLEYPRFTIQLASRHLEGVLFPNLAAGNQVFLMGQFRL